jgi:multidrug efflux pump subunit AcrB
LKGLIAKYLARPHLVLSFVFLLAVIGIIGYFRMPLDLYPDSNYPQITVMTVEPGAAASDVEDKISRPIEKELDTLGDVRRVTSTSKDEVSVVTVEFNYTKSLNSAATDVSNALSKIMGQLPTDIRTPQIFKISQASQPTAIVALSPKLGSALDLSQIRQLADNEIKDELEQVKGIAEVDVFGGHQPELKISVDPDKLARYSLNISDVTAALVANNVNIPDGLIIKSASQYLLKTQGEFVTPEEADNIVVAHRSTGDIHLRDVAIVTRGVVEPESGYHGNGHPAIGLSILRSPTGVTIDGVKAIENYLPTLRREYPGINFEISYSQGPLIRTGVTNMQDALRDAILLTVFVIFLFLGNMRITLLAAVSLPFTYLITFGVMWLMGQEFNMVTLTGVIVAVGMLLDDAIVVLENIARHYEQYPGKVRDTVIGGTEEVMLAIFSGTYATVMVLLPIIFIGGYAQTVLRPLSISLCIALVASYIVSVTIIPILAPLLLIAAAHKPNVLEKLAGYFDKNVVERLCTFYVTAVNFALRHRLSFIAVALVLFLTSMNIMGLAGRDLMPPMDTGIIMINFETNTDMSLADTEKIATAMEKDIYAVPGVLNESTVIGSEPGIVSFGSGMLPEQGTITVNLVDRFHRKATIWQIEDQLRKQFALIPGLKYVDVFEYGATPVSSERAPVDVMVSGPDRAVLDKIASQIYDRMQQVRGLTSVSRSWTDDKKEYIFTANKEECSLYEISPAAVSKQMADAVRGTSASTFRISEEDGIDFRVQYPAARRDDINRLSTMMITTPKGLVPLQALGTLTAHNTPTLYTRQGLQNTVDVLGCRGTIAMSHLMDTVQNALKGIKLPEGYKITQEGDIKQMMETGADLQRALAIGLLLLYFSLVPAFSSFRHPIIIMTAIPLGFIGAAWSLLTFGKHLSMSGNMGLILLAGIVVKNSILLIDFILEARERGDSIKEAITGSVRVRTRPILMTACGTAVGMIPIALEWAVGLERLSSLAVVAIGGLMLSTFLTLIYVPIFYTLLEDIKNIVFKYTKRLRPSWNETMKG